MKQNDAISYIADLTVDLLPFFLLLYSNINNSTALAKVGLVRMSVSTSKQVMQQPSRSALLSRSSLKSSRFRITAATKSIGILTPEHC